MRPAIAFLASLLAFSASAQTPIPHGLLEEHLVAPPAITPAAFAGRSAVASNGETFLVGTTQEGPLGYPYAQSGLMLVDADGRPLLEATGIVGGCGTIDIASDGRDYLAVNGCRGGTGGVLYDGRAFEPIAIHETTRSAFSPRDASGWRGVAWDGQQYVVLTTIETFDAQLFIRKSVVATRITATGEILQNDIDLGAGSGAAIAARDGVTVAAIWNDGIVLRVMNASGVVSLPHQLTGQDAGWIDIAAGDDGFLVVWSNPDAVRAQHLDASGSPDANPFTIGPAGNSGIAVVAEGAAYRVAWSGLDKVIRAASVGASGSVGPTQTLTSGGLPALASNGTSTLLVWLSLSQETRARPLDATDDGSLVHRLRSQQRLDALTLRSDGPAVVWSEIDDAFASTSHLASGWQHLALPPSSRERFTLLRGLAEHLIISADGPPYRVRRIDGSDETFELPSKTLFWTGDSILAVWTDPAPDNDPFAVMTLWAQRFSIDGDPLDPHAISLGTSFDLNRAYTGPAALYNGVFAGASDSAVLIAYVDPGASLQGVMLRDGAAYPIGEIASPQALANPIEITSAGAHFLVTWISNRGTVHSYIGSRRVLAGGAMPDPMRVQSTAGDRKDAMATFWTGENHLVVWSRVVDDGREVWALRIARDGTLIDYPAQRIGMFKGSAPMWAYSHGLLAMAYEREGCVYWRYLGTARRRAAGR